MKNIKKLLLVAVLAVFSAATAWGDTITIKYDDTFSPALPTSSNSVNTSATAHTVNNIAIKEVGIYKGSTNNYLMFVQNKGYLFNTSSLGTIQSVAVTYSSGTSTQGKVGVYFGTSEQSTYTSSSNQTIKGQSQTDTWTNSVSGKGFFQVSSSNKNVQITQIVITYTSGSPSYTITAQSNNTSYGTVSLSGSTITATPNTGYRVSTSAPCSISPSGSATVTQNDNVFTVTPTANTTITINFEALPKYTVTLNDTGDELTQASVGAEVTLPSRNNKGGYVFAGWSETYISNPTTTAPTIIAAGSYIPKDDIILNPIYSKTEGSSSTQTGNVFSSGNFSNNSITWSIPNVVSILQEQNTGQTAPNSSYVSAPRWYTGNKITITPNVTINSIVVTATSDSYATALKNSTYTNASATVSGTTVTITPTNGSNNITIVMGGQSRLSQLIINYVSGTTYYWSNPESTPTISADDVNLTYDATYGSISYTLSDEPETPGTLSAAITDGNTDNWLSLGAFSPSVQLTCSANNTRNDRSATITLTYTYDGSKTVNKTVTVTQSGNPDLFDSISDITEVGSSYKVKGTVVAINSRGFVIGDGSGYAYTYLNTSHSYKVDDKVTIEGNTGSYGHIIQFTSTATIESSLSSDYDYSPAIISLDDEGMANYNSDYQLSDYIQIEGQIAKDNNNYNITVGSASARISYPTTEQTTVLDALLNKTVKIKGYFAGYSSNYFTVMLESAEEVTVPTIIASTNSLSNIKYVVEEGPSAVKSFNITGSNLKSNITLSLGEISDFEMCLSENGTFTNSLSVIESEGTVTETSIYVRLKADKNIGSYNGEITISSTDADNVVVSLSGEVTAPSVVWDLSTDQTSTATEEEMTWTSSPIASMEVTKGTATTNTNNYYPGTPGQSYTSTRFYKNSILTITPSFGYNISSVVFTATTEGYATALNTSTWTNATATVDKTTVTVTPTDGSQAISATIGGTCGFTEVNVFYSIKTIAPSWSELPTPTIVTGEDYEINLADYVTGFPAPSIGISTSVDSYLYEYGDGLLSFVSATPGEYKFTFTATNTADSSSKTLTITVVGASIAVSTNQIDAPAEGTSGTVEVTYSNIAEPEAKVLFYAYDGETPASYDWITASINNQNNVSYVIKATEGTARTAYFKVYAEDNLGGDVYSELITVTQSAPLAPGSWILTNLADIKAGDIFVIVGTNYSGSYALTNDKGASKAPLAESVTISGNTLSGEIADNLQWNISGNATDGYTFYPNGSTSTWLYCISDNNGVRVGTNESNTFTIVNGYLKHGGTNRYVGIYNSTDWRCYTNTDGNIANQTFAFYKKNTDPDPTAESITLNATFNGGHYWTTYYNAAASFDLSDGAKAYTVDSNKHLRLLGDGTILPAGTAVIIISDTESITIEKRNQSSEVTVRGTNILEGSTYPVAKSVLSGTPYVLGIKNGILNFYQFTGDIIPAMKAYYTVNN